MLSLFDISVNGLIRDGFQVNCLGLKIEETGEKTIDFCKVDVTDELALIAASDSITNVDALINVVGMLLPECYEEGFDRFVETRLRMDQLWQLERKSP